jgi:hypothetical protein
MNQGMNAGGVGALLYTGLGKGGGGLQLRPPTSRRQPRVWGGLPNHLLHWGLAGPLHGLPHAGPFRGMPIFKSFLILI